MDDPLRGIVYHSADGTLAHLPLTQVRVKVFMVDVSARITLLQTFSNTSDTATGRGKYIFPVPSSAAVCAFQMRFCDGRVINGVAKEKGIAADEYARALQEGKASGLVESVTDDVFTISIGSIPPRQTVVAKVVFVMDLMHNDFKDEVRLQLPMSLGCRYGIEPPSLADAVSATNNTILHITVEIQMSETIRKIYSPSHPECTFKRYVNGRGQTSRRRQIAQLISPEFLRKDFVLTVRADGLDAPRCFAERDEKGSGTIAMQLTLVPKIEFPAIPAQEYLFVVDRSGSMANQRIKKAQHALYILFRSLPSESSYLNIISFGSHFEALFPNGSVEYDDTHLNTATEYIKSMDADFGGTELAAAMEHALQGRNHSISTVVFVLTDGELMPADPTKSVVARAVAKSNPMAPLRVFVLGIGDTNSSEVIEGIARAGNGECLFAVESEEIIGKCAKLLRAGRSSYVENMTIDWGVPDTSTRSPSSVSFSDLASSTRVALGPPSAIQQTPARITKIFPGMRFVVFVITTEKKIPEQVVLRGDFNNGDGGIEVVVQVSRIKAFDWKTPEISLIHTLAARHLITDLVDGTAVLPTSLGPGASPEDITKAAIIRLGEKYQLASRYTSFVAVDQGQDDSSRGARGRLGSRRNRRQSNLDEDDESQSTLSSVMSGLSAIFATAWSYFETNPQRGRPITKRLPGDYRTPSVSPVPVFLDDEQDDSADTYSTMSSLEGCSSDWSLSGSPERPQRDTDEEETTRSPSPTFDTRPVQRQHGHSDANSSSLGVPPPPIPDTVIDLLSLQSFDGSFSLDSSLGGIVGQSALQKPTDLPVNDTIWATALALAFLQKHLVQVELLDGLKEKIVEFIMKKKMPKEAFDQILERAEGLIV